MNCPQLRRRRVALTIIRLILGIILFAHGAQKLLGWYDGSSLGRSLQSFVEMLKIPVPLALVVIATEFFGG